MIRFICACLLLLMTQYGQANNYSPLDELVVLLSEGEAVEVHQRDAEGTLLSWPSLASRRISKKTITIIQQVITYTQRQPGSFLHISVCADVEPDKAEHFQKSLDYKAGKLRTSLLKKAGDGTHIDAIGVANQQLGNRIYLLIRDEYDGQYPLRVALPVPKP